MHDTSYTIHDTPEVVARVENDLARIRDAVQQADPRLRSLVLTGGFARGEGAMVGGVPQNDYDLVAIRQVGRPRVPYPRVRAALEAELGIHVDLAPVPVWRLRFASPSIFWYEAALRHRLLWGEDLMGQVPVRRPQDLDPREGLRLLVNRAAGLLLVTDSTESHEYRIQAAKGLLAASDAVLLAQGRFSPSQRERRIQWSALQQDGAVQGALEGMDPWIDWAFAFKVDPGRCTQPDPMQAWSTASRAILAAVPVALESAGLGSLAEYERQDGLVDRLFYFSRSKGISGARRLARHPTGRTRVATLRLLEASLDGTVHPVELRRLVAPLARADGAPLAVLAGLRGATLQ